MLYYPQFNKHTGSKLGTIFFLQICYWYNKQQQPFYKFDKPCQHPLYKENDSWKEELDFTYSELNAIRKKSGTWLKPNETYNLETCGVFVCWKRTSNLTMYAPNLPKITNMRLGKELLQKHFPYLLNWNFKAENSKLVSCERAFSHVMIREILALYQYINSTNNTVQNQKKKKTPFSSEISINENLKEQTFKKEKNSAKKEKSQIALELVFPFESATFRDLWAQWKLYKREQHNFEYQFKNEQALLNQLAAYDEEFTRNLIINAIANNWKQFLFTNTPSIYHSKIKENGRKNNNANSSNEITELYKKYSS